jgi:chromosome partitioning protein
MQVLAVANSKGGVGKTSVAVHLAVGFANSGQDTLLVDLDQQGNATAWLLGAMPTHGIAEALAAGKAVIEDPGRDQPGHIMAVHGRPHLWLAPASPALSQTDLQLSSEVGGETVLREVLHEHRALFDVVVLDCPPHLGITVLSAVCAADAVLAPVLPAFMSLAGLQRLEETVGRVRSRLRAKAEVLGYLLFAVDSREAITGEVRELLAKQGNKLFAAEVRLSTAGKALPAQRATAWDAGVDPRGAADYAAVLEETRTRLGARRARRRAA